MFCTVLREHPVHEGANSHSTALGASDARPREHPVHEGAYRNQLRWEHLVRTSPTLV